MAILVGPSIGTAKSRVFFAVDRLETKIWGTRDDLPRTPPTQADESDEEDEERDSESEVSESDSENEDADDNGPDDSDPDSDSEQAESYTSTPSSPTSRPPTPLRPKHISSTSQYTSAPHTAESSEQQRLRTASHQLSRVLATADAEGRGLQCELGLCVFFFRSDI